MITGVATLNDRIAITHPAQHATTGPTGNRARVRRPLSPESRWTSKCPLPFPSLSHDMRRYVVFITCCHVTPILRSLLWLKITERIEYKLPSLTSKALTTTQPLHNLISVQPPRSTRSSSLIALTRPPTPSSLRKTDRSFRYASPCLWNQLPSSPRQPHASFTVSEFPVPAPTTSRHSCQLTALSVHKSLSLSLPAQNLPLSPIFPNIDSLKDSGLTPRTLWLDRFIFWAAFLVFSLFFCFLVPCSRLSWLFVSLGAHTDTVYCIDFTSRREVKSKVWQSFERSIGGYL